MDLKKWVLVLLALLVLCGCAAPEELETVSDSYGDWVPTAGKIIVSLPGDAAEAVCAVPTGSLYVCDNYTVTVQTLPGGDLERTLLAVTGYAPERLTVLETSQGELDSFRTVWTAAGENGDQLGQAEILSDGNYHYVLCVMASADIAAEYADMWKVLFESFEVSYTAP
jgi:hypothetical protein